MTIQMPGTAWIWWQNTGCACCAPPMLTPSGKPCRSHYQTLLANCLSRLSKSWRYAIVGQVQEGDIVVYMALCPTIFWNGHVSMQTSVSCFYTASTIPCSFKQSPCRSTNLQKRQQHAVLARRVLCCTGYSVHRHPSLQPLSDEPVNFMMVAK